MERLRMLIAPRPRISAVAGLEKLIAKRLAIVFALGQRRMELVVKALSHG
jgi:hypothetical protein